MALHLQNIEDAKRKLKNCDVQIFNNVGDSFRQFVLELKVDAFRHINEFSVTFEHPVTIIAGTNKIGKTSLLLLLACSHEKFLKIDSTSPLGELREHAWKDVLSFTSHENVNSDYVYQVKWRVAGQIKNGEGKRLCSSKAWSGLGKKSSDKTRVNAKIRDREVRLVDLERILPGRSFSNALYRKANLGTAIRLNAEIEKAFSYVFDLATAEIYQIGSHINKSCFFIKLPNNAYSSFNAASGEESVICLLRDIIESPKESLILIDEIEAGFHPSVQRKLADIVQYISWCDKKQFIISTHSPTFMSAFPSASRRFIEHKSGKHHVIKGISHQAARSKMDTIGYPLVRLYCEDDLASFLLKKILVKISKQHTLFERLINIVESGPIDQVKNDYERHKRNFSQYRNKIGYIAVFDGDYKEDSNYSGYFENTKERAYFLYPYEAPEKFLIRAYLQENTHPELTAALEHTDHHLLFQLMVNLGLAADTNDARSLCYTAFEASPEYAQHEEELTKNLVDAVTYFSELSV